MGDKNIHFCFEAKDDQGKPIYLIYTSTLRDLRSDSPPHFTTESVITCGVPSMGCGLFGSKLVLAGGSLESLESDYCGLHTKHKGVITYDITTQQLSHSDIPQMGGGKLSPLLFQLHNKLFALDTADNPDPSLGSFEVYFPKQQRWHRLKLDYFPFGKYSAGKFADPGSKGISFFSWFTFGSAVLLSLPKDNALFVHFANYIFKGFLPHDTTKPLPFPGMAITYSQHEFDDVVVISFSKGGLVEGRRLRFPFILHGKPVKILDTKTCSHHVGDLNGWFADFGYGIFCLTAFDNVDIYVHVFKISRRKCKEGEDLNIRLLDHSMHRFKYTDFSEGGHTSFSFAGCFAPSPQSGGSKEGIEAKLFSSWIRRSGSVEEEDDVPDTEVTSPDGHTVQTINGTSGDKFQFKAPRSGIYEFCFHNPYSTPETISFYIHLGHIPNEHDLAKDEHLDPINVRIAELREALESISAEQKFMKAQEVQHRHTNESTRRRVILYTITEYVMLAVASGLQVVYIRRMFSTTVAYNRV